MEANYVDVKESVRFLRFAPALPAREPMFAASSRAQQGEVGGAVVTESELYRN